jgi:hypothetical protein
MDLSNYKNLFMIFLGIRVLTYVGFGTMSSISNLQSFTSFGFAFLFLVSLVLIYKNHKIGAYIFSLVAVIEVLLNIQNITKIDYLPSLLVWRVFGIYLAYRTVEEIN